ADGQFPGIWRISPGGKNVDLWFKDPRLVSAIPGLGLQGIRVDPSGENLYFTLGVSMVSPLEGFVYRLPIDQPTSANLRTVFRYPTNSMPAGLAFGRSGKLYVALFGPQGNQISILRPDGTEEARFPGRNENAS